MKLSRLNLPLTTPQSTHIFKKPFLRHIGQSVGQQIFVLHFPLKIVQRMFLRWSIQITRQRTIPCREIYHTFSVFTFTPWFIASSNKETKRLNTSVFYSNPKSSSLLSIKSSRHSEGSISAIPPSYENTPSIGFQRPLDNHSFSVCDKFQYIAWSSYYIYGIAICIEKLHFISGTIILENNSTFGSGRKSIEVLYQLYNI